MRRSKLGLIHFIGIGGIGMSGIAEILFNLGYKVQGSDAKGNAITERLEKLGIKVFITHHPNNIASCELVIKSSAIKEDNVELQAAISKSIPVIHRAEILAEIMRSKISIAISGTHGKTTTTSLIAALLEAADFAPTVINGGIINNYATNAYLGKGDFLVAEADESDATFIKLPASIAVITNINPEHLDYYGSIEELHNAFRTFITNLPFYGFGVLCNDHVEVQKLAQTIQDKTILTYSMSSTEADVKASNIQYIDNQFTFDVDLSEKINSPFRRIQNISLPTVGKHNILNALAAITIAAHLGVRADIIQNGFKNFGGVKRRFTLVGKVNDISIIDDYAHHPVEIKATIQAAQLVASNRIIIIFQPHRYSRIAALFNDFMSCFMGAHILIVTDIYSAGETPLPGINTESLYQSLAKVPNNPSLYKMNLDDTLVDFLAHNTSKGDIILALGAGDITYFANQLPSKLQTYFTNKNILSNAL